MIAATSYANQLTSQHDPIPLRSSPGWQQLLADAVTDPGELCTLLDLDPALVLPAMAAAEDFALRVPRSYVARMRKEIGRAHV